MIVIRSVNEERARLWDIELPSETPNVVRGEMVKAFQFFEAIDSETCWYTSLINVDCKIQYVPDFLMNFTVKRILYVIIGIM